MRTFRRQLQFVAICRTSFLPVTDLQRQSILVTHIASHKRNLSRFEENAPGRISVVLTTVPGKL